MNESSPLISIIIPAYNAAEYLHLSLGNALKQTFSDIEILVINDASSDGTKKVSLDLIQDDPRVRLYDHKRNQGPVAARNKGITEARGEYLLFVDADDELSVDVCAVLSHEIALQPADILHYAMEFEAQGDFDKAAAAHMQHYFTPQNIHLHAWEIVESAFLYYEHNWNLAGKLIKTSVCNKALEMMPQTSILLGEDLLFYFFIACHANTYRGYANRRLYRYRYGAGGSNRNEVDLDQFNKRWLSAAMIPEYIISALEKTDTPVSLSRIISSIRTHLLGEAMDAVSSLLAPEDKPEAISRVSECWSVSEVVCSISQTSWRNPYWGRELLACDTWRDITHNEFHNVCFYSASSLSQRVVERAARAQDMHGFTTSLYLTEEPMCFDNADLPDSIEPVSLYPRLPSVSSASFYSRAKALERCVRDYHIGHVIMLDYFDVLFFWDVALLSLLGVTITDVEGNDLTVSLTSEEALETAIKKGLTGEDIDSQAQCDFMREHLGRDYALLSYRNQAQAQSQIAQSRSYKVGSALTKPYRYLKRIMN